MIAQKHSAIRICLVHGTSNRRQGATRIRGIERKCRMASERNPPRVPPPRIRLATTTKAQRKNRRSVLANQRAPLNPDSPKCSRAGSVMLLMVLFLKAACCGADPDGQARRRGTD